VTTDLHYVVCLRTSHQDFYVLWEDGGDKPDRYVTVLESRRFLCANNRAGLVRLSKAKGIEVSSDPAHLVNIAEMQDTLARLRPGRPLSQYSAQVLLESWNALEDMCRSTGASMRLAGASEAEVKHVYDRLFYGNNLPSVTPEGRSCKPAFNSEELAVLRSTLRSSWQEIARISWPESKRTVQSRH
jgi:hypothetical protein